jgi:alpha-L-arabinofuranosidase
MKTKSAVRMLCIIAALYGGTSVNRAGADTTASLDVDVNKPGPTIPKTFYGLMTEEINHAYDGGLYAELIQNRSFQDPPPRRRGAATQPSLAVHWSVIGDGKASLDRNDPVNPALPVSLRLELSGTAAGVANDGYWGIPVRPDTTYTASFYAKGAGGFAGPVTASIVLADGHATVAKADSSAISSSWQKYTLKLTTGHDAPTMAKAQFVLSATGSGSVSFSMVSLFPPTYQNAPNGLRPDLMKFMADMHPAFIRLPGGNYAEGSTFQTRFNWKQMIGPADQRPGHMGCWGYRSSDGFGMPEYLLWCKQLNAEPVLAVFAGYVLNRQHVDAGSPEMAQYTQEALEEIEYVSGPADSEWGKKRAADGFAEPFPLHYVEIGNEDWFDRSGSYDRRFTEMAKAIREKYPQLKIIATAPVKSFKPDLYDDHFYRSAKQLMNQANQYDGALEPSEMRFNGGAWNSRQPDGILTFVGEWATQEGRPTPDLNAALADAAFVMRLEKNCDVIPMECYAPLLVNVNPGASQWPTNLIGYDALHSFGSPSYYAQALLGQNKGDVVIPATLSVAPQVVDAEPQPHGSIGVGATRTQVEYKDVVVTAPDGKTLLTADLSSDTRGWRFTGGKWDLQDKAIKPSAAEADSWALTGDDGWTDYTIHLRARKVGGRGGFTVIWHATDANNYNRWVAGGNNNAVARCEFVSDGNREAYGPTHPFTVEMGQWYDLRLEVSGRHVRAFVDDKLVTDATDQPHVASAAAFASATYATADHALILKVVNIGKNPLDMAINLHGVGTVEPNAIAWVMSGDPKAQNTIDEPTRVSPRQETLANASASFRRTFPPYSLTLVRLVESPQ